MTTTLHDVTVVEAAPSRGRRIVLAATGAHLVVGLLVIGRTSLWGDEAFTAEAVRLPLGRLLSMLTRIDVNMSAYYLLLKSWTTLFGTSETALRLPSLIMTTATVGLAAWLVSRWFGPKSGAMTAVAMGLNPFFILIGVTARPFAMLALLFTASLGLFVAALGDRRPLLWICLVLVDILAFYSSLLAALFIATQVFYLLAIDRRLRLGQLLAGIVGVLGCIPALVFLAPGNTLNWLARPSAGGFLRIGWEASGWVAGIALVAFGLDGLVRRPEPTGSPLASHPRSRYLLPAFVVVPLVFMLVLLPVQSLFTPPYLVCIFVGTAFVVGVAVATMSARRSAVAVTILAVGCLVGICVNLLPSPTLEAQNWRATDARLDALVAPGDAVVFPNTFYRAAGEYYSRSGGFTQVASARLPDVPWFSQPPDRYDKLKRTGVYRDTKLIVVGVGDVRTVWLVGPDDDWMGRATSSLEAAGWSLKSETGETGLIIRGLTR